MTAHECSYMIHRATITVGGSVRVEMHCRTCLAKRVKFVGRKHPMLHGVPVRGRVNKRKEV